MKKIIILTFSFFVFLSTNAQTNVENLKADQRIYDFYPKSKIEYLLANDQSDIIYMNTVLNEAYKIKEVSEAEMVRYADYKELEIKNLKNINTLAMGIYPLKGESQIFRIKNTNKILMIMSEENVMNIIKNKN